MSSQGVASFAQVGLEPGYFSEGKFAAARIWSSHFLPSGKYGLLLVDTFPFTGAFRSDRIGIMKTVVFYYFINPFSPEYNPQMVRNGRVGCPPALLPFLAPHRSPYCFFPRVVQLRPFPSL